MSIAADGQAVNEKNGYQCTVKGGREGRELDAATLARAWGRGIEVRR